MDDLSDNAEKILQFIHQNPGSHLRQIKREMNVSMGTAQYHLDLLEKKGRIISERHNLHRHYFPAGIFNNVQKNVLKFLTQETAREILMIIIERKNPTQKEIVDYLGISAPSITWHISRMLDLGLIGEEREGKFKRYNLLGNSNYVVQMIKTYHPSIWDNWSNRLAEMFLSLKDEEIK